MTSKTPPPRNVVISSSEPEQQLSPPSPPSAPDRIVTMEKLSNRPPPTSLIRPEFEEKMKNRKTKLRKNEIPKLPHWRVVLTEKPNPQNSIFKCSKDEALGKLHDFFGEGLSVVSKWSYAKKHKKLTVQASSDEQYNKLLNAKKLTASDSFNLHTSIDESRIWGCAKIPSDKEIKIVSAKDVLGNLILDHEGKFEHRLKMKGEDGWIESKKGVFTFGGENLPHKIKIKNDWVQVEPYVFPTRHCLRCTSYTHSTHSCVKYQIGKPTCAYCSGPHEVKECKVSGDPSKAKCNHCQANHPVWSPLCAIRQKERLANEHRAGTRKYRMKSLQEISDQVPKTKGNNDREMDESIPRSVSPCEDACSIDASYPLTDEPTNDNCAEGEIPNQLQKVLVSMFALLDYIINKTNLNAPVLQNLLCQDLEIDTKFSGLYKDIKNKILSDQAQG